MTLRIWSSIIWGLHRVYVKEFNEKHFDYLDYEEKFVNEND